MGLSKSAQRRIAQTVIDHERQPRGTGQVLSQWRGGSGREQWFQLDDNLDADGSAQAYPINWSASGNSGDGEYTADTAADLVYVYDLTAQHCGLRYDWVLCRPIGTSNGTIWEVIQGGPTWRKAVLNVGLNQGSSIAATATVRGSSVTVTVYDAFLASGDSIASSSTVGIAYSFEDKKWYATEAVCS